ncbi:MAG: polysaccharide export protein [Cellvibrionaceae bacterium]
MRLALVLATMWLLSGCASNLSDGAPIAEVGLLEEYRIGVGDQLQVSVWKNKELSLSVPVRPDGKISMPLIGDVLAAGKEAEALAADIGKQLSRYVREPQVTVIIVNPGSSDFQRRVRVSGAVGKAMSIAYRDGMTVLDLVLMAGGLNEFASGNRAKLYRKVSGEVRVYPVKLVDILERGKLETNYQLMPSDIVTVPERSF